MAYSHDYCHTELGSLFKLTTLTNLGSSSVSSFYSQQSAKTSVNIILADCSLDDYNITDSRGGIRFRIALATNDPKWIAN